MAAAIQLLNKSEDIDAIYEIASIMNIDLDEDGFPFDEIEIENVDAVTVTASSIKKIEAVLQTATDLGGDCPPMDDILDIKSKLVVI